MKKLFFGITILSAIVACKKTDSPVTGNKNNDRTEMVPNPEGEVKDSGKALQILGEDKVAELLKTKDNDTLYVTNFFATWCGPCMIEIPYFKTEMEKLKGEKVKFTFVSVDHRGGRNIKVKEFGNIQGLSSNIVLFDMVNAAPGFAKSNTNTWNGGAIPFTRMSKGNKVFEKVGTLSEEEMQSKLNEFK